MLTINRINHCNLALSQARSLGRLLKRLKSTGSDARVEKEILASSENLAATLANKRYYTNSISSGIFELDPRFLLFEYCHGILLRESQVSLIRRLLEDMVGGRSVCHQMIMGAGKTTVVGPLLAMILTNCKTLVFEVVPPALLEFSAGVLRERFSSNVRKPVFTFGFERYFDVTPMLLAKLETARSLRAVIVASPSSIKSFMLKFLEICHNLSRQKAYLSEEEEKKATSISYNIRRLLGLFSWSTLTSGKLTEEQIKSLRKQAVIAEQIFEILKCSIEIMDEVDVILHPLKSELNWPLGSKDPLDFTRSHVGNGLRWNIPSHLFDAIFHCCGLPIIADIADSRVAGLFI